MSQIEWSPREGVRHGRASRRPRERKRMSQLISRWGVSFIDWLGLFLSLLKDLFQPARLCGVAVGVNVGVTVGVGVGVPMGVAVGVGVTVAVCGGVGRGCGVGRGLGVALGVGVGVGVGSGVYSSALATGKIASGTPSDQEGARSGSTGKEALLLLSPAATRTMPLGSNVAV